MEIEKSMQEEINKQRDLYNRPMMKDPETGQFERVERYSPGDKKYLPPVTDFITIQFHNGLIVMPANDFNKLPKGKQKKLMRW